MRPGSPQRRQFSRRARFARTVAAGLLLAAAPPAPPQATAPAALLGSETVPGGDFTSVGPDWRQLHPQQRERLTVVPDGWHARHLGGAWMMPLPGVDPDDGDPCMVFLYKAGRVDLFSDPFLLDGPGTYLLSLRTRSVVRPTAASLRAEVHLLPDDPAGDRSVVARWFGDRPPRGSWTRHRAVVHVPADHTRAEIHLVKEVAAADFLIDDVSLRRIEELPALDAAPGETGSASPGRGPSPYDGLRAYGGDPHVRTGLALYSVLDPDEPLATGTPEGAFTSAVENGLDWAAVANVSSHINSPRGRRWREERGRPLALPGGGETFDEWEHLQAVVRRAHRPGEFVSFLAVLYDGDGFASEGGSGRKIILLPRDDVPQYCSPRVFNAGDCPTVRDAYRYARHFGAVMIASSPCPAAGEDTTDWSRYDDPLALMEIFGGLCESGPGGLVEINSRRELRVGAAGGSGDRTGTAGLNDRTICWAHQLTREALLDAMARRLCYWSAAGHLELKFEMDGVPMGGTVQAGARLSWSVEAVSRDSLPFLRVEVLRDGDLVDWALCTDPGRCSLSGEARDWQPGIYHAAVEGVDGERVAVSSPIVVRREAAP